MSQRLSGVPFRDVQHTGPALLSLGPQAPASGMLAISDARHAERYIGHARYAAMVGVNGVMAMIAADTAS